MNLPRKLLISKIQRDAREEGEKERARTGWNGAELHSHRGVLESKEMQRQEKKKGREKERNEASDTWYREQCEKNQCGSKNHLEILKEKACSAVWNLDYMVVKFELLGRRKLARAPSTAFSVFGPQNLLSLIMILHHHQLKNVIMKKAQRNLLMKFKRTNSSCSIGRNKNKDKRIGKL